MRIFWKLVQSVVIQAALLSGLALYVVDDAWERYRASRQLIDTVREVEWISKILHEVQRERGYSAITLAGASAEFVNFLAEQRARTDAVLLSLRQSGIALDWAGLDDARLEGRRMRVDARAMTAEHAIREYSEATTALLTRLEQLAIQSASTHDFTRPLIAHAILQGLKEYAGVERALVAWILSARRLSDVHPLHMWVDLVARQEELERRFLKTAAHPLIIAYQKAMQHEAAADIERMREAVPVAVAQFGPSGRGATVPDAGLWFVKATERIEALAKIEVESLGRLTAESARASVSEVRKIALVIGVLALALLAGVYYAGYALHSVAWPMRALHAAMLRLARDPHAEIRADVTAGSEIGELAAAFNCLNDLRRDYDAELRLSAVVFKHALEGLLITDAGGTIISVNPRFCEIMGYQLNEIGGKHARILKSGDQEARVYGEMWRDILTTGSWHGQLWNRRKDGSQVLVRLSIATVWSADGDILYYVGVYSDITEQYIAEQQLRQAYRHNQFVIASLGEGLIGVNTAGEITFLNPEGERLLCARAEELAGRDLMETLEFKRIDDLPLSRDENPIAEVLSRNRAGYRGEMVFTRRNGEMFPVDCIVTPMGDGETVTGAVIAFQDISLRKQAEEEILYLAYHDGLTGLPNRRRLEQHLQFAISQAKRFRRAVAVLFIDLDRFKQVNDTLGHSVGDALLTEFAKRLRAMTRESDLVARLAGDEFVLVISTEDAPSVSDAHWHKNKIFEVMTVAQKIIDAFERPVTVCGHELFVSLSIGISVYPYHAEDVSEILQRGDEAMYRAKELGGNTYAIYARVFSSDRNALSLETRLRRAIQKNEFVLHYQPIVDLSNNRIVGVEALVRWQDGESLVAPGSFIPFAEQSGLIIPISDWVMHEACRQLGLWRKAGFNIYVAVNISARHLLRRDLSRWLRELLADGNLPPSALELEVTEHTGLAGHQRARRLLRELRAEGLRLALDDFGTGYSCLARIRDLPVNVLKIDRSFTADIQDAASRNSMIVKNVISLARDVGLTVLAEGVEDWRQWQYLSKVKCDLAQGYYFCPPTVPEEIDVVLRKCDANEAWFAGGAPEMAQGD